MTLNEHIDKLYAEIKDLKIKMADLDSNPGTKDISPISKVGGQSTKSLNMPISANSGMGAILGGGVVYNSEELTFPGVGEEVPTPDARTKSYNQHTHSQFSGGALIKDVLEIVEYDLSGIDNPHNLQNLTQLPEIKKEEGIEKIGLLDLIFNPNTQSWGVASYEIDIKKCYFVERDEDGEIVLDEKGQEKKSPLYNEDPTKTAIIWDENAGCWRLYATYAPGA